MHDFEKLREFLNFVDDHPFGILSGHDFIAEPFWFGAEFPEERGIEEINPERL
jgi:hypothetical protein